MSSSLLLRLVLVLSVVLTTEVLFVSGLELEEDRAPFEGRVSSIGRFSYPQIYNLYLEPARKGASFDFVQPEKRSRLFVGKRISDVDPSDEDDVILLSEDNDDPFDVKRNHLFVGRRASPRFVGKRSVTNQPSRTTRKKRYAPNEYGRGGKVEDSNEGRMWKLWVTEGAGDEQSNAAEKRSRMFVGKRRELEADEKKRSRLFVGKRAEAEDEEEEEEEDGKLDSWIALPTEVELSEEEAAKRSRLFVGKRPLADHSSMPSAERFGAGEKEPGEIHTLQGAAEAPAAADKRVHLFPGKRPAPGFVGKRENQK